MGKSLEPVDLIAALELVDKSPDLENDLGQIVIIGRAVFNFRL